MARGPTSWETRIVFENPVNLPRYLRGCHVYSCSAMHSGAWSGQPAEEQPSVGSQDPDFLAHPSPPLVTVDHPAPASRTTHPAAWSTSTRPHIHPGLGTFCRGLPAYSHMSCNTYTPQTALSAANSDACLCTLNPISLQPALLAICGGNEPLSPQRKVRLPMSSASNTF